LLGTTPLIIADVAHNAAGLQAVLEQWAGISAREKHIVLGFVRDKDVRAALALFPTDAVYHFCNAAIPRAMPVAELAEMTQRAGLRGESYASVQAAVEGAQGIMSPEDALLITGSFFVVGEAMEAMDRGTKS
jgi:dihydrofolate synthase/folylpolyglutamate synthase